MSETVIPWTIEVSDLLTTSRVGIWDHERESQPIRVSLSIRAIASACPQTIDECVNYQSLCHWLTDVWPTYPHTPLLESRARELLAFLFDFDPRIEWVDAALSKPNGIPQARGVGVRLAMSRDDHAALLGRQPWAQPDAEADPGRGAPGPLQVLAGSR